LGLALVKALVYQNQGLVEVESEVGRHSTVSVFFAAQPQRGGGPGRGFWIADWTPQSVASISNRKIQNLMCGFPAILPNY